MGEPRFPTGFGAAVRRFNAGEFFEAHERFEELLDEVEGDDRWNLLVALIQVAVGYHKLTSDHPGAARMLRLGAEKLAAFPPVAWGVAVERLRRRIAEDLAALETGGARLAGPPPRIELVKAGPVAGAG
ncbi:MAG: DUF309 domain-containing protein [Deltaproteobacteria bacterium]|nr:MAG: DUF309 domain-containing protein [Deltaproteobacteria bacterium]